MRCSFAVALLAVGVRASSGEPGVPLVERTHEQIDAAMASRPLGMLLA